METIRKVLFLLVFTASFLLMVGCGAGGTGSSEDGIATITGQFKLESNTSWNNISVLLSGKTVMTTATDVSGNFSAVVDCGSYSISAGKAGYDTANITVSAATNGNAYDIGTHYLGSQNPPGTPPGL